MNSPIYATQYLNLSPHDYMEQLKLAFAEDNYEQDVSTLAIFEHFQKASGKLIARQSGVIAGLPVAYAAFQFVDPNTEISLFKKDGDTCKVDEVLLLVQGDIRSLLRAERVALNFLGFMSGIATTARKVSEILKPLKIIPLDTRKTIPGLRRLSKYAVAVGGAYNHRMSLADMGLIKDNHIAQAGSVQKAIEKFKAKYPQIPLEVEVENIEQLKEALPLMPERILLDNMTTTQLKECTQLIHQFNQQHGTHITSEASGGFTLDNLHQLENSGVDFVSLGSLTSRITPIDFSLEIIT